VKAYRFHRPGVLLQLDEIPVPKVGPTDVLIRVKASGLCGTDMHYIHGLMQPGKVPIVLSHEAAGVVEKVGEQTKWTSTGDRVVVHYPMSCGVCVHCSQGNDSRCRNRISFGHHVDGGFSEYVVVPERQAFKLSDEISFEQGAIIGCAVSTPFHALRVGEFQPGDSVAIFGLGGVGMHGVAWARVFGARLIVGVDISDFKLRLAKELGADATINAAREDPVKAIMDLTDGWGVEISVECAGTKDAMRSAIASVCGKVPYASGRVVSVAAMFDPVVIEGMRTLREGAFKKSGDHTRDDLRRILELVKARRIDLSKSITHRLPFEKLNDGVKMLGDKRDDVLRIVVYQ